MKPGRDNRCEPSLTEHIPINQAVFGQMVVRLEPIAQPFGLSQHKPWEHLGERYVR